MSPKYRSLYLLIGGIGFIILLYQIISYLPYNLFENDPIKVLAIAVPDMVFVFLAYKTYPPEPETKREQKYHHRKVSNY
jgi:hypothetical protein